MEGKFLYTGRKNPFFNMALDYFIWKKVSINELKFPVLRIYEWSPPSVSLGYNQNPSQILNVDFCKKNKIPFVKRPTGGSAIFHDIEITYSFSGNIYHHPSFSLPFSSYIQICKGIIKGIKNLTGIELQIRGFSYGKEPSFTNKACFTLLSRHDIIYNGKKIVGSAQRRDSFSFLQHGSILIEIRKNLWENIFFEKIDFSKIGYIKEFFPEVKKNELIFSIKNGFEEIFGFEFKYYELKKEEIKEIEIIRRKIEMEGKYE